MNNVQNCDSYINISSSQTYKSHIYWYFSQKPSGNIERSVKILNIIHRPVFYLEHCIYIIILYFIIFHKRMARFKKLIRNLFLTLHGHSIHCQQQELSKFLMGFQQFASHAYCRAAGLVSKMASQQEKVFCELAFWGVQICDYRAAWVLCTV
jgi:hypothetical protein